MEKNMGIEQALKVLSDKCRNAIVAIPKEETKKIQEIRLRKGKYISVCIMDNRITSYNVCYTKLLRKKEHL